MNRNHVRFATFIGRGEVAAHGKFASDGFDIYCVHSSDYIIEYSRIAQVFCHLMMSG